ncbi:Uncharacterised protein [Enterobacter hormaechei]|nr:MULTISPECIES: sel1 repeat family protein [Enterobacteriaceae]MCE9984186.1 sel1 repeat family protein [Leclercia adecarboxylata]VAE21486.1 Uncharacterised protein [Enterobacter hormaechei]VAE27110.1 Uncharacterised protein [Enterobacter hormaechei]
MEEKFDKLIKAGDLFFVGEKLPSDFYQAHTVWSKEAAHGNPKAYYNLGYCSLHGEGTEKDWEKALFFYNAAFEKGINKAGKPIVWLKAREILGTLYNLRLFDTPPNEDTPKAIDRLKNNISRFQNFCNEIKSKGCSSIDEEINKVSQLIILLELNDIYHKGDLAQFKEFVDKIINDGHRWALQIRGAVKSSIISKISNLRTTDDLGSHIVNGNTKYLKSKPYYKYSQAEYIKNVSDTVLYFSPKGFNPPVFVMPGEKAVLDAKSGKSDYQYNRDGSVSDIFYLTPFNDISYFKSLGIDNLLTAFKLPVEQQSEFKDEVHKDGSGFTPSAVIFITLMFFAVVFTIIMARG